MVNEAKVDCLGIEEGSGEFEVGAIIDSFKPGMKPRSLRVEVAYDTISEMDMQYSIRVVNGRMGMLIAEEVLGVNSDVKDGGGMGRLKLEESHRIGLSEMRGNTWMSIDRSNGVVIFISTNPLFPDVMEVDEGDGKVAWEEVYVPSP
eukprot:Gb_35478 [translate_table: standard]